jgi:hypothetical protein
MISFVKDMDKISNKYNPAMSNDAKYSEFANELLKGGFFSLFD